MKRRIRKELLAELLAGYENPEDLTGPEGLLKAAAEPDARAPRCLVS